MKNTIILLLLVAATAFSDVFSERKLNFYQIVARHDCTVVKWSEDTFESGEHYRRYARVECSVNEKMPVRIAGLNFIDVTTTLTGNYLYIYGEK